MASEGSGRESVAGGKCEESEFNAEANSAKAEKKSSPRGVKRFGVSVAEVRVLINKIKSG